MKGLGPRAYNILFHTHTVCGIVISAALFIIFFSGAITLFKNEFFQWEDKEARIPVVDRINYEEVILQLDSLKKGFADADEIRISMPTDERPIYYFNASVKDSLGTEYVSYRYNPVTRKVLQRYQSDETTMGETLYRLHFFDQIPVVGRYLAGLVSLFFAFAVITGLLIHWRHIGSKFYAFSFKKAGKQFWTNAHTVFGIIGLPFQLMYAITGVLYLLSVLVLAPAVMVLYKGNQQELITQLYPLEAFHHHSAKKPEAENMSIAMGLDKIQSLYPEHRIMYLEVLNLGRENALLGADLVDQTAFNRDGIIMMDLHSGNLKMEIQPGHKTYTQSLLKGIGQLHFATFGGSLLKICYFILALLSCFVIVSGVLIWKQARYKDTYTDGQRRFHHRVTMVYLAVCFSLFPATALLFISEQLVPMVSGHAHVVNTAFFSGWLLFAAVGCFLKKESRVTRFNLWLGGILALGVPISNGLATDDWFWLTLTGNSSVFGTDICWLLTGVSVLATCFLLRKNKGKRERATESMELNGKTIGSEVGFDRVPLNETSAGKLNPGTE